MQKLKGQVLKQTYPSHGVLRLVRLHMWLQCRSTADFDQRRLACISGLVVMRLSCRNDCAHTWMKCWSDGRCLLELFRRS